MTKLQSLTGCAIIAVASIVVLAMVAAGALLYIESRFGVDAVANLATGAAFVGMGAILFVGVLAGHWMTNRTASRQAEINSDIIHDAVDAFGKVAGVQREYARAEREQMAAATRRDQIDEARVWRLAEKQRRLLAPPQSTPTEALPWQVVETDDAQRGINYVE